MFPFLTFGFIITLISCQNEENQEPSTRQAIPKKQIIRKIDEGEYREKFFRQDLSKSYQDLANRPWVLAIPRKPHQDINFSSSGNE